MLYLLLMEERYGVTIERGLLQYLNSDPPEVCFSPQVTAQIPSWHTCWLTTEDFAMSAPGDLHIASII